MQPVDLPQLLSAVISPVALISGIGLILLSMTNRYTVTLSRARALCEALESGPAARAEALATQLQILRKRAVAMRWAILLAAGSVFLVAVVILVLFAGQVFHLAVQGVVFALFAAALLALVAALGLFILDFRLSLDAFHREVERALGNRPR